MTRLNRDFYARNAAKVAKDLLGCILCRKQGPQILKAIIVETEAYRENEKACHAYGNWLRLQKGQSPIGRSALLFGAPGFSYVYLNYGVHWLFNVVCEAEGCGSAVLIRAVEPISGLDAMNANRGYPKKVTDLTSGPGKLTKALAIDKEDNAIDLVESSEIYIEAQKTMKRQKIVVAKRIGISKAQELPWRFYLQGNAFVSKL